MYTYIYIYKDKCDLHIDLLFLSAWQADLDSFVSQVVRDAAAEILEGLDLTQEDLIQPAEISGSSGEIRISAQRCKNHQQNNATKG